MNHLKSIACLLSLLLLHAGCDETPTSPPVPSTAAPVAAATPAPSAAMPEYKPEYTLAIEESTATPKTYTVTWSAKVNTGGWTMKTDRVLIEELNGANAARVWVILEQPGPSDMTTQAIETLTGKHDAGTTKIERAEFSVKRVVRGASTEFPSMYAVVKTIKYPY